jgi:hypothetical protein
MLVADYFFGSLFLMAEEKLLFLCYNVLLFRFAVDKDLKKLMRFEVRQRELCPFYV